MPILENTVNGNLNVKGTTFTKNLDVSGTAHYEKLEVTDVVEANGGMEVDGLTMKSPTSMINFPDSGNSSNQNASYPYNTGGIKWVGQSDGALIFCQETEVGNMNLCIKFTSDESNGLVIFNKSGKQVARIGADGRLECSSLFISNREVLTLVQIADLRDQIDNLTNQKEQNETRISELETQVTEMNEILTQLDNSGEGMADQITQLTSDKAQLQTENEQLKQKIRDLGGEP